MDPSCRKSGIMFDIGWTEFLFVSVIALLVLGPKELPALLRAFGRVTARVKSLNAEFRSHLSQLEDEVSVSRAFEDAAETGQSQNKPSKKTTKSGKSDDLFSTLGDDEHG